MEGYSGTERINGVSGTSGTGSPTIPVEKILKRKYINIWDILHDTWEACLGGIFMCICMQPIKPELGMTRAIILFGMTIIFISILHSLTNHWMKPSYVKE